MDFFGVVMTFGVADGSLDNRELAILADLLCYLTPGGRYPENRAYGPHAYESPNRF